MEQLPTCITEDMLLDAVKKSFKKEQAYNFVKIDEIYYSEVLDLKLDFKQILKIDHLTDFTTLAKLDLKNNLIKDMQGLESLVNLKMLNLSFNRIEKIEGLDSLRKLELLNLSNNRITVIENMDNLENLSHFFISNNFINQLENLHYLKRFKKLFQIYMVGNPVSMLDDYKLFIAAYFPNMKLLDDALIDETTREAAASKYKNSLDKIKLEQQQKKEADKIEEEKEAELQFYRDAYVEFLNGTCLFDKMFAEDPEAELLSCAPGVASLTDTLGDQVVELCTQLFNIGLTEHTHRQKELKTFYSHREEIERVYKKKTSEVLADLKLKQDEILAELQELSDQDAIKLKVNAWNEELTKFRKTLLLLEFEMDNWNEDEIKKLDSTLADMVLNFSDTARLTFAHCRELEDAYCKAVREIAVATLEKVADGNLDEEMPEDALMLFTDKYTVMDALATAHNNHQRILNDQECIMVTKVNDWKIALIKGVREGDLQWNHMRISDINRYIDHLRRQLERFL